MTQMRRRSIYFICFLLFLSIVYFYINYAKLDPSQHKVPFQRGELRPILRSNGWQKVARDSQWYIYSAYVDSRLDRSFVRIISMTHGKHSQILFCKIWYSSKEFSVVDVQKHELWVNAWDLAKPGQYYQPFLLSCPLSSRPIAVSVVSETNEEPINLINLTSSPQNTLKDFIVCLKPLDFEEDISFKILEWLELQFLLGADRVFIYIYNVHPNTWKILNYYNQTGKIVIKAHSLPGNVKYQRKEMNVWQKRRHEMAVYNDCFYRHIHTHKFVVNLDLDEAIVPVLHNSWFQLLKNASTENPKLQHSASMSASNVYFFDSFSKADNLSIPCNMHMLQHVYRSANFTPPGFAQKSFFSTNFTLTVSNHFALQSLRPSVRLISPIGIHLVHLHHYRKNCPSLMQVDCKSNYMKFRKKDTLLWKFKNELVHNIWRIMQELNLE